MHTIDGDVTLFNTISPRQLFPNLKNTSGSLKIISCTQEILELPTVSVGSDITIQHCPSAKEVIFNNLEVVKGEIHILSNYQLNLFSIPKLKHVKSINLARKAKELNFNHNIRWSNKSFLNSESLAPYKLVNPGPFERKGDAPCNDLCQKDITLTFANYEVAKACYEIKGNLTLTKESNLDQSSLPNLKKV